MNNSKDINLSNFEVFYAVGQAKSITAAANAMGLSKAAVSQSIKKLEFSIKCDLFCRTTRSFKLTDAGEILYLQCETLKRELDGAREIINNLHREPRGTLRIACNPYFCEMYLNHILEKYNALFPKVNYDITTNELVYNPFKDNMDIVFGMSCIATDNVVAISLLKTRYILCASPGYTEKHGIPRNISELQSHSFIAHKYRKNDILYKNEFIPLNKKPFVKVNSIITMKQLALNSLGIVQLHEYMVKEEIYSDKLVQIDIQDNNDPLSVNLYYHRHRYLQPKVREFINLAKQRF